ncbi:MAG: MBL fold metallo-hydrolase [Spirochaetota bacterium]
MKHEHDEGFGRCPYTTWPDLFRESRTVRYEVLRTGDVKVKTSLALNLRSPRAAGMTNETQWVGVDIVAVTHPDGRVFLLDAGLDSSYQRKPTGRVRGLLSGSIATGRQEAGQSAAEQLGPRTADLAGILFTHLHFDHIAGACELPSAGRYVCGPHEKPDRYPLIFTNDYLSEIGPVERMPEDTGPGIPPFGGVVDVLGDRSIWAIPTPGHSRGSVSYLFRTENGMRLFVGDACMKVGVEQGIGPGDYSADRALAETTMFKIAEFARENPEVEIIYAHEFVE